MSRRGASRTEVPIAIGDQLTPVGTLMFETRGRKQGSAFRYADSWLANPQAFALSPAMPMTAEWRYFWGTEKGAAGALPPPISDCAPDAWGRSLIAARPGRRPNELENLLGVNDATRQGALRFLNPEGQPLSRGFPATPRMARLPELRALCQAVDNGPPDEARKAAQALRGTGDSLGGARAKSDFDDEGVLCLAKYTSERDGLPVERMEVATLALAKAVDIRAAKARLALPESRYPVALLRRFDREGNNRRHYVSGQSFLGRVQATDGYYTELAEQMLAPCAAVFLQEMRELHSRILFTILVSNTDDHMKNHGFLYGGQQGWMLSPMFDVNPQPERERRMKSGISPLSGFEPSIEAAIEAAPFFEITEDEARKRASGIARVLQEQWRAHCCQQSMSTEEISAYAPAFEHAEMRAALKLAAARSGPSAVLAEPESPTF